MSAPATLAVEVTADDIRLGKPSSICECAIALAISRLPGVDSVFVEFGSVLVRYVIDGLRYGATYNLPEPACDFIEAFDREQPVEPVTFTATLEEWS
jgi:hypothetical protein